MEWRVVKGTLWPHGHMWCRIVGGRTRKKKKVRKCDLKKIRKQNPEKKNGKWN